MKTNQIGSGMNRTGIGMSPIDSKALIEGAETSVPSSFGDGESVDDMRHAYAAEGGRLGSVPPPATLEGAVEAAAGLVGRGQRIPVFLDKLGERLAFERSGSRLYEALIAKLRESGPLPGGPSPADLEHLHHEELEHFAILTEAVRGLGADPTVVTPAADVAAVASMGLVQVLADPRTSFVQGLQAILIAELADNDGWSLLVDLTEALGHHDLVGRFREALRQEDEHLARVRGWMTAIVLAEAAPAKGRA